MCGRFAITLPPDAMRRLFDYAEQPNFPPRYNIAPTQPIPIVRTDRLGGIPFRHFALARWGFLPGFVKNPKDFPLLFNARSESLAEKASFRNALRRRRCLVPADCFYEWQRFGSGKTGWSRPFLFQRADSGPLAFAGLWETWTGPNGEEVDTACIITTACNGATAAIHPRLPAIIEAKDFGIWLDPDETRADDAAALLKPAADDRLSFFAIGDLINKVANDGAAVQAPLGEPPDAPALAAERPAQGRLF